MAEPAPKEAPNSGSKAVKLTLSTLVLSVTATKAAAWPSGWPPEVAEAAGSGEAESGVARPASDGVGAGGDGVPAAVAPEVGMPLLAPIPGERPALAETAANNALHPAPESAASRQSNEIR